MNHAMRVVGVLTATFSIISLIQHLFEIGILGVAEEMVDYYRTLTYFFLDMPVGLFGFHFPAPLKDLWTLSFVGAGAYVRTPNVEEARFFRRHPEITGMRHWKVIYWLIAGFTGMGLVILLSVLSPNTYVDEFHEEPLDLMKQTARNLLWVLVGVVGFFAINAYGPSV